MRKFFLNTSEMVVSPSQGVKMCLSLSPLYGVLVVILMSPLFGVFSRVSLVKEAAATSRKVSQRVVKRRTHGAFHQ